MKCLYFVFPTHHIQSTHPAWLSSWLRRKTVASIPYTQSSICTHENTFRAQVNPMGPCHPIY